MVVPYGSSDPMHSWKAVHDGTEYGFGTMTNSLTLGCDCLGEIHYLDVNKLNFDGSVETIENGICLHEEDFGVQWKHTHSAGEGHSEVRRSRRLVISAFSAVGNYDSMNSKKFKVIIVGSGGGVPEVELEIKTNGYEEYGDIILQRSGMSKREMDLIHANLWLSLTGYVKEDVEAALFSFYMGTYIWSTRAIT